VLPPESKSPGKTGAFQNLGLGLAAAEKLGEPSPDACGKLEQHRILLFAQHVLTAGVNRK
jgi:hypothetical protein